MQSRHLRLGAASALLLTLCLACGLPDLDAFERPGFELKVGLYGPCLVDDVNGDGVGELAMLLYNDFERQRPALVDGATGEVLWEGEEYQGTSVTALCVGESHFAVAPPNSSRLDLFPVASPDTRQRLSTGGRPLHFATAPGCFRLRTQGQRRLSFRLGDTVTPGECEAQGWRGLNDHLNTAAPSDELPMFSAYGSQRYALSFRGRAPELVQVGREGAWTHELSLLPTGVGRAGALAVPDGVVVVGQPHPEVEDTVVIGFLSAADGASRAEVVYRDANNTNIGAMVFNGRYAVVKLGNTIHAYHPTTGVEAWSLGHTNLPSEDRWDD